MSSTPIPTSSVFPTMPAFPSIRAQTDTAYGATGAVGSSISSGTAAPRGNGSYPPTPTTVPELNRIYFNKKQLADTYRELHTDKSPSIRHIWEIPFSCDADTPVAELTRRIDAAMEKTMSYSDWTIDYSQFIIKATEK